ncbi:nuclease-related domain-containing protein [Streptomyces tendae]|uniref:nuclease-related domain-containing protein n=1 Tax=Streptomyces tendae TaxID=1932 RepID=UPI003570961B
MTGDITVLRAEYHDDVIAALIQHLQQLTEPVSPDRAPGVAERLRLPPLTPADDLAVNPPGASLRDLLDESGPRLLERAIARVLRRPTEWDAWRKGLEGERRVGAELNRLGRHGWRVLHSIPLATKVDIDHLLIGPGGVFSINTKHAPPQEGRVGRGRFRESRSRQTGSLRTQEPGGGQPGSPGA